ncbi:Phosphatidylserine decarboxylase proenzyme 2 precursor [Pelomyxa schiedti]|nr:Phosphatidylserine decarboxylase proenzyme 2 precursor [Pelomyxa schiedti]
MSLDKGPAETIALELGAIKLADFHVFTVLEGAHFPVGFNLDNSFVALIIRVMQTLDWELCRYELGRFDIDQHNENRLSAYHEKQYRNSNAILQLRCHKVAHCGASSYEAVSSTRTRQVYNTQFQPGPKNLRAAQYRDGVVHPFTSTQNIASHNRQMSPPRPRAVVLPSVHDEHLGQVPAQPPPPPPFGPASAPRPHDGAVGPVAVVPLPPRQQVPLVPGGHVLHVGGDAVVAAAGPRRDPGALVHPQVLAAGVGRRLQRLRAQAPAQEEGEREAPGGRARAPVPAAGPHHRGPAAALQRPQAAPGVAQEQRAAALAPEAAGGAEQAAAWVRRHQEGQDLLPRAQGHPTARRRRAALVHCNGVEADWIWTRSHRSKGTGSSIFDSASQIHFATTTRTTSAAASVGLKPSSSMSDILPRGLLEIKLVEGRGLMVGDLTGSSDPYCIIKFAGKQCRSNTIMTTLNPRWEETFHFVVPIGANRPTVLFEVWDWDKISSSDFLGKAERSIADLQPNTPVDQWITLTEPKPRKSGVAGQIHVIMTYQDKKSVFENFWREICKIYDIDGNGTIEPEEFNGLVGAINSPISSADLEALFHELDTDNSGSLTWQEFCAWILSDPLNEIKLLPYPQFIWEMMALSTNHQTLADAVNIFGKTASTTTTTTTTARTEPHDQTLSSNTIYVKERITGQIREEKIPPYIKASMRMMYSSWGGKRAVNNDRVRAILKHLSVKQGESYSNPKSAKEIMPFIAYHNLSIEEMQDSPESFKTFNEFFYRKLKDGQRPIDEPHNPAVAVSPADCRLSAYQTIDEATRIWIKGVGFNLQSLLGSPELAEQFSGGSIVIARLSPQDYHRFHSCVTGRLGPQTNIDGTYYTVNPVAIKERIPVFQENKRCVMPILTQNFGKVMWISVGATMVGTICWTKHPGDEVVKGQELGYFAFGGSTVLLLFQRGTITLDPDLLANSYAASPIETYVHVGNRIGVASS